MWFASKAEDEERGLVSCNMQDVRLKWRSKRLRSGRHTAAGPFDPARNTLWVPEMGANHLCKYFKYFPYSMTISHLGSHDKKYVYHAASINMVYFIVSRNIKTDLA